MDVILIINSGSSSIKFALFALELSLPLVYQGKITQIRTSPYFSLTDAAGAALQNHPLDDSGHPAALAALLGWVTQLPSSIVLRAAGHRVVHGGRHYIRPVAITPEVMKDLRALTPLAPLHQPANLAAISALQHRFPALLQVACFDTAFHASESRIMRLYALPRTLSEEGIIRYGFHGLSYEYIASILPHYTGTPLPARVIVAHLGNGASMCAMKNGRSFATSMGFTALDGLVMGTRSGSIDPGVILYLLQEKRMTPSEIETLLYHESGLLGVSGISNNMQELLQSAAPAAKEAVALFCNRATQEIGALVALMGGLDMLVFTAGIGENAPAIRAHITAPLQWMGIQLDDVANNANTHPISSSHSPVAVYTIPTNEERMIAHHTAAMLGNETA